MADGLARGRGMAYRNGMGLQVVDWGLVPYGEALARQEALLEARIRGEVPDTLVLTEHPPVITLGTRQEGAAHVRWSEAERAARGVEVFRLRRGGDVTAHEPGQLVGYPIIDLSRRRDLHKYLRDLEEGLIRAIGCLGVAASRREGKTGVWVGREKVAAIGVAVRHWVTWHGFALNVRNDLALFSGIVPCGISDTEGGVTSLARILGAEPDWEEVKCVVVAELNGLINYDQEGKRHSPENV